MWRAYEDILKAAKQRDDDSIKYELEARKRIYPTEARHLYEFYKDRWVNKISLMKCLSHTESIITDFVGTSLTKSAEYAKSKRRVLERKAVYNDYNIVLSTEQFHNLDINKQAVVKFYRLKHRYSIMTEDFTIDLTYVIHSKHAIPVRPFEPRLDVDERTQIELEIEFNNRVPFDAKMQQMFMGIMSKLDAVAQQKIDL
jgi:hypothetical protein